MKKINEIFNFNKNNFKNTFDYKSYIPPKIYQHSIYYEGDMSSSIYVDSPVIKYAVEEMRQEILSEIKKYNPNILELKVYMDKGQKIAKRNEEEKKRVVKKEEEYKKNLYSLDEVMVMYNSLNEMKFSSEKEKEYFLSLLRKFAKEHDKNIEECKFCGFDKRINEDCLNCLILEKDRKLEKAIREIEEDNFLVNNSKIYVKARKILFDRYFSKLITLHFDKKSDELKKNELLRKCAIIKSGSEDVLTLSLVMENLEKRIKKIMESNISFNYE